MAKATDWNEIERRIVHQKEVARDAEAYQALSKVGSQLAQGKKAVRQRAGGMLASFDTKHSTRLQKEAQAQAEVAAFREISEFEAASAGGRLETAEQRAEADTVTHIDWV